MGTRITLKKVRLAFPKIWTPEAFPRSPDPTKYFSATFLIAKDDPQLKAIDDVLTGLAKEKWPKSFAATLKTAKATGKVCLRDGDTKAEVDGYEGMMFLSARSKTRPTAFDNNRNETSEGDDLLYGGCYVNASVELFAYDNASKGIGAGLRGVQFVKNGDRFGSGAPADKEEFEDEISAEDEDPLTA